MLDIVRTNDRTDFLKRYILSLVIACIFFLLLVSVYFLSSCFYIRFPKWTSLYNEVKEEYLNFCNQMDSLYNDIITQSTPTDNGNNNNNNNNKNYNPSKEFVARASQTPYKRTLTDIFYKKVTAKEYFRTFYLSKLAHYMMQMRGDPESTEEENNVMEKI